MSILRTPQTHPLKTIVLSSNTQFGEDETEDYSVLPFEYDYTKDKQKKIIPKTLNPMIYFKNTSVPAVDQGDCGSCWAFASVGCLTERINYALKTRKLDASLSPSVIISCDEVSFKKTERTIDYNDAIRLIENTLFTFGCHGNFLSNATVYLHLYGTYEMKCAPYILQTPIQKEAYDRTNFGYQTSYNQKRSIAYSDKFYKTSCFDFTSNAGYPLGCGTCVGRVFFNENVYFEPPRMFRSLFGYSFHTKSEDTIMNDILKHGPLMSSFIVYQDFYDFDPKHDIYFHSTQDNDTNVGGHAVLISGWGEENGIKFWWIKNSWGVSYGMNGYFKMRRGTNECGIEDNIVGLMPNLFPKNQQSLENFMDDLLSNHGFYYNSKSNFPSILQKFLIKSSYTLDESDTNKIITQSLVQKYPMVDYFFFNIQYPLLYHIDPSNGFNINYIKSLQGLDFSWKV
jgi:hypothetical protein